MRLVPVLIVLVLATALILSGCLQVPDEDEDDPGADPGTDDDPQNGSDDGGNGDGDPGDTSGGDDGDDNGGDGGNGTDEEDMECHEYDRPRPAKPEDHEVDTVDEIRCPGQFTITDEGDGQSWEVPTWSVGDWWRYEIQITTTGYSECREIQQNVTGDSGTRYDLPVYDVVNTHYDCDGQPTDKDPQELELTQGHLMHISRDGYIEHNARFPLTEGKSWSYMGHSGDLVEIEDIEYDDSHGDPLDPREVWHVGWGRDDEAGSFQMDQTWSVDARNILEETITVTTESGVFTIEKTLKDSTYDYGQDDGPAV